MTTATDIWSLTEPYLAAEHLELDDLELSGAGKGRRLRVVVDGPDLDIDRLAEVSRGLSRLLDNEISIDDSYQLEVTSPGLERNLRRPSHYQKSIGREIRLKVAGADRNETLNAVIVRADDSTFTVEVDDESRTFEYGDVLKARTTFRWEKAPKPGH